MNLIPTPEEVIEMGKQLEEAWLASLTVDDMLARLGQNEVLSHIKPVDRLAGLEPKEVLSHFKPVDRLAGLEPEVIEDYLKQLKKQQR
jgi:alanine racemase